MSNNDKQEESQDTGLIGAIIGALMFIVGIPFTLIGVPIIFAFNIIFSPFGVILMLFLLIGYIFPKFWHFLEIFYLSIKALIVYVFSIF